MFYSFIKWISALLIGTALVAIAIPYFVKSRSSSPQHHCIGNLKLLDGATQHWAVVNKKDDKGVPVMHEVVNYLKDGILPKCPQGGSYKLGATVLDVPTCSLATTLGHSLPH